jgi:hypothetical protein
MDSMRISPWHLPDAPHTLIALRLHKNVDEIKTSTGSAWFLDAIFQNESNGQVTLILPWVALPLLKCGEQYQNGLVLNDSSRGILQWIKLGSQIQIKLMDEAIPEIQFQSNPWVDQYGCHEWGYTWDENGEKFVLPVLVAIQALLTLNDTFSSGVLDPTFLYGLGSYELNEDVLTIHFRSGFPLPPQKQRMKATLVFLARLLLDPSFATAFFGVAFSVMSGDGIKTSLPDLQPKVYCWVTKVNGINLIDQIVYARPQQVLPIKVIQFLHPDHKKLKRIGVDKARPAAAGGLAELHLDPLFARNTRKRVFLSVKSPIELDQKISIVNLALQELDLEKMVNLPRFNEDLRPFVFADKFSANAKFPKGEIQIKVGQPLDEASRTTITENFSIKSDWEYLNNDGFGFLYLRLKAAKLAFPELIIEVRNGSDHLNGLTGSFRHKYVLVRLTKDNFDCWMIEFTQTIPNSSGISTLIIQRQKSGFTWSEAQPVVSKVLMSALSLPQYHWSVRNFSNLESEFQINLRCLKHSLGTVEKWVERVFE